MAANVTRIATLGLDEAVLSSGAVLSAAGGGLPQRIAADSPLVIPRDAAQLVMPRDIALLADGRLVRSEGATNALKGLMFYDASGVLAWGVTAPTSDAFRSVAVDESLGEIYGLLTNTLVNVYDLNGTLKRQWTPTGITSTGRISVAATDMVWVAERSANIDPVAREYDRNGFATGRTCERFTTAGSTNTHDLHATTEHIWVVSANTNDGLVGRRPVDGGAIEPLQATRRADTYKLGEYTANSALFAFEDDQDVIYAFGQSGMQADRYDPDTLVATHRIISPGFRQGQATGWLGINPDGRQGFDAVPDFAALWWSQTEALRIPRRTSRATFTRLFSTAATLTRILVPGSLGNERDATYDDRKTRCYYSTNGVDFTEFTPGTPLSVAITAGATLTVRVDMSTWAKPTGTPPWIGGDSGEGISLIYEEPDPRGPAATVAVTAPAAIGVTVTPAPTINVTVRD